MNEFAGVGTVFFSRIVTDKFGKTSLRYGVRLDDEAIPTKVWFRFGGESFDAAVAMREARKCYAGAVVLFEGAEVLSAKTAEYQGESHIAIEARRPELFEVVTESDYQPAERKVTQFL